jgi:hypothetical protein
MLREIGAAEGLFCGNENRDPGNKGDGRLMCSG